MTIAALVVLSGLPAGRRDFEKVIAKILPADQTEVNLAAWDLGGRLSWTHDEDGW